MLNEREIQILHALEEHGGYIQLRQLSEKVGFKVHPSTMRKLKKSNYVAIQKRFVAPYDCFYKRDYMPIFDTETFFDD